LARLHNQTAAAIIGNPIATLKRCIHGPGFGKNFSHAGCQLSTRYGAASPAPTVSRIRTVSSGLFNTGVKPTAKPRNGAVQEVARTVVRKPLKNAPRVPCFDANCVAAVIAPEPSVTSNTPNRFRAINVTRVVITMRKYGLAN